MISANTYAKDKRKPIDKIYHSFEKLKKTKWNKKIIYLQKTEINKKKIEFPILAFETKKKGKALWLIAGIHGEEPAGPNAISENISFLNKLAEKIPIVLLPLCNPSGYARNWRYPYLKRFSKNKKIISVGDSEHFLLNSAGNPRKKKPSCEESFKITKYILKKINSYFPVLVLDFHEDKSQSKSYIYSQGILGDEDPVAREIVKILKKRGFNLKKSGKTIFNQDVQEGIVSNVKDGSIDELLASDKIIIKNKIIKKPSAKSVVVIETNTIKIPIKKRIKAHSEILKNSKRFFEIAEKI